MNFNVCETCGSLKDRRTCDLCKSYEALAGASPLAAKSVDLLFRSKLGTFKTFRDMQSAAGNHGATVQRERAERRMFRAGQKKITDYFK